MEPGVKTKFTNFIRRHDNKQRRQYLIGGGVVGIIATISGIYISANQSGGLVEKSIALKYELQFKKQSSFMNRLQVYHSIPEFIIPISLDPMKNTYETDRQKMLSKWLNLLTKAIQTYRSSHIAKLKDKLRNELLEEALSETNLENIVEYVQLIMGPCVEKNILLGNILNKELTQNGWVDADILRKLANTKQFNGNDDQLHSLVSKMIVTAISFYPGSIPELIKFFQSPSKSIQDVPGLRRIFKLYSQDQETSETEINEMVEQLEFLQTYFQAQDKTHQNTILQDALTNTIRIIPNLSNKNEVFNLYKTMIHTHLIQPLEQDACIPTTILTQVKEVFLALPPKIQARVLLTGLNTNHNNNALLVKELLSSGGVVAIKLAQMLAEDPLMPSNYRELLGSLRDDNEPMSLLKFWNQLPSSIQDRVTQMGKCLGTGSVKQVQIAKGLFSEKYNGYLATASSNHVASQNLVVAIGVLRPNVQSEALSSLEALSKSEDLAHIADRLASMVYGEFNLFEEGRNLKNIQNTSIGKNKDIDPVKVIHNSPSCLVESMGMGPTVSTLSSKYDPSKSPQNQSPDIIRMMALLGVFHKAIFDTFVEGHIHSDVHLGNMVYGRIDSLMEGENNEDCSNKKLVIFDVGQFQQITKPEILAISWTLACMTNKTNFNRFHRIAVNHLSMNSYVNYDHINPTDCLEIDLHGEKKWLKNKIQESLDHAIKCDEGEFPDKKRAYMIFLKKTEDNGIIIPQSAFAVAKMIDGILSQQQSFSLEPVFEQCMEDYLMKNMRWSELGKIMYHSVISLF